MESVPCTGGIDRSFNDGRRRSCCWGCRCRPSRTGCSGSRPSCSSRRSPRTRRRNNSGPRRSRCPGSTGAWGRCSCRCRCSRSARNRTRPTRRNPRLLLTIPAGFPVIRFTVEQVVAEGDLVAVRWTGRGIHRGEWQGVAATGRPMTDTGINLYRIGCGRIVEGWSEPDAVGLLQQIGGRPGFGTLTP